MKNSWKNMSGFMKMRAGLSIGLVAAACSLPAGAQEKPTMGWSSWNTFALNISESVIKNQATAMKRQGLLKAGYNHINIDDGYFGGRDPQTGELLIHPTRFPNGLKPVVNYIHLLGMKAGIYSDAGHNTCGNYHGGDKLGEGVGLYEHDQEDCDFFFKECGFDFIKVDFCGGVDYHNSEKLNLDEEKRYRAIAKAIENTGREDVRMNICRWAYPGNSGGWDRVAKQTLTIELEPGHNTVRLYGKSSSAWMPNIDCMTLKPVGSDERIEVTAIRAPEAETPSAQQGGSKEGYYTIDGRKAEQPEKGIYVHQGKKVLF